MNFLSLILWKIINPARFELFEFRQLEHLLEILCYHWWALDRRKVQQKCVLAWFWRFELIWPKRAKLCQLPSFYNFVGFQTSPIVQQDI
jgi:hypothetical protein